MSGTRKVPPQTKERLRAWADARGVSLELLREVGCRCVHVEAHGFCLRWPYLFADGSEAGRYLALDLPDGPGWRNAGPVKGAVMTLGDAMAAGTVVVAEGESDAVAAFVRRPGDDVAVVALPGSGMVPDDLANFVGSGARVVVATDADEAGDECAAEVARVLAAAGVAPGLVRRLRPALEGVERPDLRDLLASLDMGEPEVEVSFRALLEGAPSMVGDGDGGAEAPAVPGGRFAWAADVHAEQVDWLWADRIPRGAVTILAGDPGLGKSILTCELAARVSRGQAITPGGSGEPGRVLMLTAEDSLGAVVRPRLELAGADLGRVALDEGAGDAPLTLPSGLATLAAWMREHRPALVVIDPVVAFLDGDLNPHRDADVRRALRPLADLAAETAAAVVAVMHFNKAQGAQPLYRLSGSIGFAGAARSMLVFGRRPDAEDSDPTRVVAVAKSSYAALAASVELSLTVPAGAAHPTVGWRGEVPGTTAADLLRPHGDAEDRSALDEAVEWLRGELGDGERPAGEVQSAARSAGVAVKTLRRARERVGVVTRREGFGARGGWLWSLPEIAPPIDAQPPGAPMETPPQGHLWQNPHGNGDSGVRNGTAPPIDAQHSDMGTYGAREGWCWRCERPLTADGPGRPRCRCREAGREPQLGQATPDDTPVDDDLDRWTRRAEGGGS